MQHSAISKAKLDTASAACEGGLVAHDRSGVFYWGSRVSAVWELVRAEPTSLTLATKPHRGGAVTGGFTFDWRETGTMIQVPTQEQSLVQTRLVLNLLG